MAEKSTVDDVARWMLEEVHAQGFLHRERAVHEIDARFGDAFVYRNVLGKQRINRKVLTTFRKLGEDSVVWDESDKNWRSRRSPGSQKD
jgi:hypothetical protein